ncbi:Glycoside hydrolase family 93 protein [Mycena kentingensis (nom. inval.)]|nr:Glycoside hydrolase family 93 protein [Mycena kentingensis (nom. inval.)]
MQLLYALNPPRRFQEQRRNKYVPQAGSSHRIDIMHILPFVLLFLTTSHALDLGLRADHLSPSIDPTNIAISPSGGGTYPRLACLSDGSILGAYTVFRGTTKTLTVTRSTNGGRTFSAWGTVAQSTGDLDNLFLQQLPNGDVLATFRNHDVPNGVDYTWYRITAYISHNNGRTWAFLSQIDERGAALFKNGLWEPFARIAHNGAIQVYYSSENDDGDQDILMKSSPDNGTTWSLPFTVAGGTTHGRDGMPGLAEYTVDGVTYLLCVFETTEGTGTFTVKSVVSTDDGASWGGRASVYVPTRKNAGAPQIATTSTGTLVVSFMTDEDNTSPHNWARGAAFKIITSASLAVPSWGQKTTVLPISSYWPSLLSRTDGSGTVIGCADTDGARCRSISFS